MAGQPDPRSARFAAESLSLAGHAKQAYGVLTLACICGIDKPFLTRLNALDSALFAEPAIWERPF